MGVRNRRAFRERVDDRSPSPRLLVRGNIDGEGRVSGEGEVVAVRRFVAKFVASGVLVRGVVRMRLNTLKGIRGIIAGLRCLCSPDSMSSLAATWEE